MKYKHIIWDWNGTLLNDLTLCVDLLNVSLEKRKLPEMTEEKYRKKFLFPIKTFYESIGFDFSKEDFTITFPSYLNAQGNETGSVLVNGVHAVGDTTIAMDAFAADGAGRFKAGDFIKFNAHSKVYMVVEDVTSSSNAATVTIEPPLTTALSDNEAVIYDSVPFTVFLTNDVQEFPSNAIASDGTVLFTFELDVEESI